MEELDVEGTYFRSRIGDNFRRATEAWFAEGRAAGVEEGLRRGLEQGIERGFEQGLERGLEQQRLLLLRQVATKFGADVSARVGPLFARIADSALLAEVADGLLVSATEAELVARVEAVIASTGPSSGD